MADEVQVVAQVVRVQIDRIEVPEKRIRPVEEAWAQALAGMLSRDGQITPIEVLQLPGKTTLRLVAGAHRIAAARILGWTEINAIKISNDSITARTHEIHENLARRELGPIDFAASIAGLYTLLKEADGFAEDESVFRAAGAKRAKEERDEASAQFAQAFGWAETIAENVGFGRRKIYQALSLHRKLQPILAAAVRGTPVERNAAALADLADLQPVQQLKIAEALQAGQPLDGALQAIVGKKRVLTNAEKGQSALWSSLSRMSAKQQGVALGEFVKIAENHGWRITFERISK